MTAVVIPLHPTSTSSSSRAGASKEIAIRDPDVRLGVEDASLFSDVCLSSHAHLARAACGTITGMFQGRQGPLAFIGKSEPSLDLEQYVLRLLKYMEQWSAPIHGQNADTGVRTLAMAIELLHRLHDLGYGVCPRSVHRLVLTAVLISTKSTEDFVIPNRFWSKVGGVPLAELNELELTMCKFLSWRLTVDAQDVAVHRGKMEGPSF